MEFGLWFEPEMISPASALMTEHPDWLLQPLEDEPRTWRHQYVLDVARPEVFAHLLSSISGLVSKLRIDFIKWDMNRDVADAVHDGRAGVVRQTKAVYDLMDAVRSRHPGLEIESCASGGARVDLGVIEHTDRVWPSDTNDPIERLEIQSGTELLLPPELIGTHVGAERAHTTHRSTNLDFRIAAAFTGSFGIEWDISECTPDELTRLQSAIRGYKRLRPLLHSGTVHHHRGDDEGLRVTSIVATSDRSLPRLLRVPGLQHARRYRLTPVAELQIPEALDVSPPPWLSRGELALTGAALARRGIRLPLLGPGQALMLELKRLDG
jgi:alpha-galactosidase